MTGSRALLLVLALALVPLACAQTVRVGLNGRTHLMQDGSRLTGWRPGPNPLRSPPAVLPSVPIPAPATTATPPMPGAPALTPSAALAQVVDRESNRLAAFAWDGPAVPPGAVANAEYANLVQWLTNQYGITDTPRHERIWRYYQDEREDAPGEGGVDPVPAGNAVTRYVWTRRDPMNGRLDWTRITPGYKGPAQIQGVGVWFRRQPGGAAAARVDTPTPVTLGAVPARGGWFHARDPAGNEGWVSVYWIVFP